MFMETVVRNMVAQVRNEESIYNWKHILTISQKAIVFNCLIKIIWFTNFPQKYRVNEVIEARKRIAVETRIVNEEEQAFDIEYLDKTNNNMKCQQPLEE